MTKVRSFVVALVLTAVAVNAQAQSTPGVADFSDHPTPLNQIIIALAKGKQIEGAELLPDSPYSGKFAVNKTDTLAAINNLLEESSLQATVSSDSKVMKIAKVAQEQTPTPTPTPAKQATAQKTSGVTMLANAKVKYDAPALSPQPVDRCGWGPRMEMAPSIVRQYSSLLSNAEFESVPCEYLTNMARTAYARAAWTSTMPWSNYDQGYGNINGQYYGNHNQYGYGGYGYGQPWMVGCQDGRPTAFVEIAYKGKRGEKSLWMISINGIGFGTVDQADTLGQKIPVCSDAAVIVTVEKIGLPWMWERQYSMRPFTSTELPVGEFLEKDKRHVK